VERLVSVVRQGPPGARVEALDVVDEPDHGIDGFRIR